jgi:hypothetical protein
LLARFWNIFCSFGLKKGATLSTIETFQIEKHPHTFFLSNYYNTLLPNHFSNSLLIMIYLEKYFSRDFMFFSYKKCKTMPYISYVQEN